MSGAFGKDYFCGDMGWNYGSYDKRNHSKIFKGVVAYIKNQKITGRFLDVGCALGFLLKEVSPLFSELYGCDISNFAVNEAKKRNKKANLRVVNLEKTVPYEDNFFDCITALDVLEHTKNLEESFNKIIKKLRPGGYFILSMPINGIVRKLFGSLDKDETHISILKEKEIMGIVNKSGMKIIKKRHFAPCPFIYRIYRVPAELELVLQKPEEDTDIIL